MTASQPPQNRRELRVQGAAQLHRLPGAGVDEPQTHGVQALAGQARHGLFGAVDRVAADGVACMEPEAACPRAEVCPTLSMWQGLDRVIRGYLDHITMADLMGRETAGAPAP